MNVPILQPVDPATQGVSRRGFTLVELLVVMAVMVVLAAMLFPVMAAARDRARKTTCLSHLRQLVTAQALYLQDYDECFPGWFQDAPPRPEPIGPYSFWTELFQPYMRSEAVFHDPSFTPAPWPVDGLKLADYALLSWGPGGKGTERDPYWRWPGPPLTLAQMVRPVETCSLMDGYTTTKETQALHLTRHGRGRNAAFVDGHARWLPAAEMKRVGTDGRGYYWWLFGTADR